MSATIASYYTPSTKEKEAPPAPKIDENRILANGMVGFFTALMPLCAVLGLTEQTLYLALLGAFIQGGLSAAQEYKKEAFKAGPPASFILVF